MDARTRSEAEQSLRSRLRGSTFGNVHWLSKVGSTNDAVLQLGRTTHGKCVLVADYQSAGRGRRGRTWTAPAGSALLMSLLLPWKVEPEDLVAEAFWTVAALSLSVHEALGDLGVEADIKWPNDVLVGGRKIAGVLAEIHSGSLVVGVGINIDRPRDVLGALATQATWVGDHVDCAGTLGTLREELAVSVVLGVEHWLSREHRELVSRWKQACGTLGQEVSVEGMSGRVEGAAVDVDPSGALVIERDAGRSTHHVGDVVHLRPIAR